MSLHLSSSKSRSSPRKLRSFLPVSKAEESVGRVCRDRLRPVFMSLFNSRGEPIQFGSSQLLFPEWLRRVGLVGALIARSYICNTREDPGHIPALLLLPPSRHFSSPIKFKSFLLFLLMVVLGMQPKSLYILGKHSATEIHPQTIFFLLYYKSILLKSGLSEQNQS